jgi:hypothetical protein
MRRIARSFLRQALGLLIVASHVAPAWAGDCNKIYTERGDELSFATRKMGDTPEWSRVKKQAATGGTCDYKEKLQAADCEYRDANGVRNLAFGKEIVRQILEFGSYRGKSIAGISGQDKLIDVLRKLRTFGDGFPLLWITPLNPHGDEAPMNPDSFVVGTGLCLRNKLGTHFGFDILFDRNYRIKSITAGDEGP